MFSENHMQSDPKPKNAKRYNGETVSSCGYIRVYKPSHPNADGNYMMKHRLVVEYYIGRYLLPHEIVHHIDHNKKNNDFNNLQILSYAEHRRLHNITDKKGKRHYDMEQVKELYEHGYSSRKVADLLNIGKSTVASYVKELGISRPKNNGRCPISGQFSKGE